MKMKTSFKKDLKDAQKIENKVLKVLRDDGFTANLSENQAKGDILIISNDVEVYVEVKHDKIANSSGNFYLEYFNQKSNKSSGLQSFCENSIHGLYCIVIDDSKINKRR